MAAPETWRLAEPFKLPKDMDKLKYPARSDQLFETLNLICRKPTAMNATEATSRSQGVTNEKP